MSSSLARAALRGLSPETRGRAQPLGGPGPPPGGLEPLPRVPGACRVQVPRLPFAPAAPYTARRQPGPPAGGRSPPSACGLSLLILLTSF